ncbi:MAG: CU044_2847 family protein [Nocardioides sp.]
MTDAISFETDFGVLYVETQDAPVATEEDISFRGSKRIHAADQTLESALDSFLPAAASIADAVKRLHSDGVAIELGLNFSAEIGVALAKASSDAHILVTLTWSRSE